VKADPGGTDIVITLKHLGDEALLKRYLRQAGVDADIHELKLTDGQALGCRNTSGDPNFWAQGDSVGFFSGHDGWSSIVVTRSSLETDDRREVHVAQRPDRAIILVVGRVGLACAAGSGTGNVITVRLAPGTPPGA
jgi:hypothetical protein